MFKYTHRASKHKRRNEMTTYQAKIRKTAYNSFFAMVVRVDQDGEQDVVNSFRPRHFSSLKAAEKATQKFLANV
jgi:hypothetical protein